MAISMHSASVPIFVRMLGNLITWLDKAEAHATAKKFEPSVLPRRAPRARHAALPQQIQIACDAAKFCVARLAGVEAPKFADNETTHRRPARSASGRRSTTCSRCRRTQIDGSDAQGISVPRRAGRSTMTGETYLKHFVLPNFFFHVTTTYALLRHNGVELGKTDYLGATLPRDDRDLSARISRVAPSRGGSGENASGARAARKVTVERRPGGVPPRPGRDGGRPG